MLFTGSTEVARLLQRTLAGRARRATAAPVPLIAETGGQNAMIVDSSALAEQVVADVVTSAFDSAGQRCSALRVLCVQDDIADAHARDAARRDGASSRVGDPARLATDVGPVIDDEARAALEAPHRGDARARPPRAPAVPADAMRRRTAPSSPPTLIEIDRIAELEREVFGPVLHVVRYEREDLDALSTQINAHRLRPDARRAHAHRRDHRPRSSARARAGNVYVNRNIVGAVVGVQPFGGEGLSGTGPKAGGPLYLLRLLAARPDAGGARRGPRLGAEALAPIRGLPMATRAPPAIAARAAGRWLAAGRAGRLDRGASTALPRIAGRPPRVLPGPTGERNTLRAGAAPGRALPGRDDGDLLISSPRCSPPAPRAAWPSQHGRAGCGAARCRARPRVARPTTGPVRRSPLMPS